MRVMDKDKKLLLPIPLMGTAMLLKNNFV